MPGLGEGLIEKLSAAGVTTVEALADMTPEQLEAIEGIGPKTVEKISLAVNNYFSSLERWTGEAASRRPLKGKRRRRVQVEEAAARREAETVPIEEAAQADEEAMPKLAMRSRAAVGENAGDADQRNRRRNLRLPRTRVSAILRAAGARGACGTQS